MSGKIFVKMRDFDVLQCKERRDKNLRCFFLVHFVHFCGGWPRRGFAALRLCVKKSFILKSLVLFPQALLRLSAHHTLQAGWDGNGNAPATEGERWGRVLRPSHYCCAGREVSALPPMTDAPWNRHFFTVA